MKLLKHSLAIIVTFAFVYAWQITPLGSYTLALLGVLIFAYIVLAAKKSRFSNLIDNGGSKSVLVLNIAILLFIASTGGLHSPLFFLLYFVLFGIAFVFHPLVVFVYVLCTTVIFISQILSGDVSGNILTASSLYLIAPLAYFFGTEYSQRIQQDDDLDKIKETSASASEIIQQDVDELTQENPDLSTSAQEKLAEIKEEAATLRQKIK